MQEEHEEKLRANEKRTGRTLAGGKIDNIT